MRKQKSFAKKLMKSKLFIALLGIFLIGNITAFYILSFNTTTGYTISGGVDSLVITQEWSGFDLNVSDNLTSTDTLLIENPNGMLNMTYVLNTSELIGTDPSCEINGDLGYEFSKVGYGVIGNGTFFNMSDGSNEFEFAITAINPRACPRAGNVTMSFTDNI